MVINLIEFKILFQYFGILKNVKFITGTTGSKINNLKQVGVFDKKNSKFMTNELSEKKIFSKS